MVRFRKRKLLSSGTSYSCKIPVKCKIPPDFTGVASAEHISGDESLSSLTEEERNDFKPNSFYKLCC